MVKLTLECLGWEATKQALSHAESIGDFDAADVQKRRLSEQAVAIFADARKLAAVQQNCPDYEAEMEAAARSPQAPSLIVDPASSDTAAATWASSLSDEQLKLISDFVGAEKKLRKASKR